MSDRLYELLPTNLRQRDHAQGEPLRALMRIFEAELRNLELETETIYDDWFIETCSEWLVPYIGESLGIRGMRSLTATGFSTRAYVANTLDVRRRKGTAYVLEQLARDLTRHGSAVEEYFTRLVWTPHLSHVREAGTTPATLGTFAVRDPAPIEWLGRPFGSDARTPDVRAIERSRASAAPGLWNIPHVGLHLWTLQSRFIVRSEACAMEGEPHWYRFDPFGRDVPLFNRPYPEREITTLAGAEHVARALSRFELSKEERAEAPPRWLGPNAVLRVRTVNEAGVEQLFSCARDLVVDTDSDGIPDEPLPPVVIGAESLPRLRIAHLAHLRNGDLPTRRPRDPRIVHVDPENGRLVFHPDAVTPTPAAVLVDYAIGHAGEVGAGPWDRSSGFAQQLDADEIVLSEVDAHWGVSRTEADGSEVFETLGEALLAWNTYVNAVEDDAVTTTGLISIMDSRAYTSADADGSAIEIELPPGARLVIVAASWPANLIDGVPARPRGRIDPSALRPIVRGELVVHGTAASGTARSGGIWLNGLAIEGGVRVRPGTVERLSLRHVSTSAPTAGIRIEAGDSGSNPLLVLEVSRSFVGPIVAEGPISRTSLLECVVHGDAQAIELLDAECSIQGCTLLGSVSCRVIEASDSIFSRPLIAELTQQGCVRFSYLAPGSRAPRRYRCQPDLALEGVSDEQLRVRILARVRPVWTSFAPGQPAYAQLGSSCPVEIRRGAEDGLEMGVWFHLQLPWREDNLRTALGQNLRHGLEAGLRYES